MLYSNPDMLYDTFATALCPCKWLEFPFGWCEPVASTKRYRKHAKKLICASASALRCWNMPPVSWSCTSQAWSGHPGGLKSRCSPKLLSMGRTALFWVAWHARTCNCKTSGADLSKPIKVTGVCPRKLLCPMEAPVQSQPAEGTAQANWPACCSAD